jgi:hypothetical protein
MTTHTPLQNNEKSLRQAVEILNEVVASTAHIKDDAKRIKDILLHRHKCIPYALINKCEIVGQWNKMEQMLHIEAFWTFINPKPDDPRYAQHRMNYVIEMLLRCEKDATGSFVDVDARLQQNPHYLFERCVPIMLDMEAEKVPFLQCDLTLDELMEEELLMPVCLHEISPGMFALWMAVKMMFERMWSWYTHMELDYKEECFEADANGVRDLLSQFIEAKEEDLVPTGKTLWDYLKEY